MSGSLGRALEIFREALDLEIEERAPFLDRECSGDTQLRQEVDALLDADEVDEGDFSEESLLHRREGWDRFLEDEVESWKGIKRRDPETIGKYEIVRRIGEGGMGIVYEAKQDVPRRSVALKVLSAGVSSAHTLKRFQREAQVLGRLVHPGIAQIFEAGTFDGVQGPQPYFAMELVDGQSLRDWAVCAGRTRVEKLKAFCAICEAVHHAHERGVVHRDLKPENVIMTREAQPKVLDFGVARASDGEERRTTMRTVEGQLLGTVAYMSPEQASGGREEVDGRSDVYSLGVMLFELLTDRLPHPTADLPITEAVHALRSHEPQRLRDADPTLRGDLDTIVSRALEREPRRRYASAQALADEVRRHLLHEPIKARPTTALYTLRKMARRHRGLTAGAVLSVLTLLGGLQAGRWLKSTQDSDRSQEPPELNLPIQPSDPAVRSYRRTLAEAKGAIEGVRFTRARDLLREAVPVEQRGWEWYHLMQRTKPVEWMVSVSDLRENYKWGTPVAFSEDGTQVFALLNFGTIGVWEADTGREIGRFPRPAGSTPNSMQYSKGRLSFLGSNRLVWISAEDGSLLGTQDVPEGARTHRWSASGDRVGVHFGRGEEKKKNFELWCGPPEALELVAQGEGVLNGLCWTREDEVLYGLRTFGGYEQPAYSWNTASWEPRTFEIPSQGNADLLNCLVSGDGSLLVAMDKSAVPRIWNLDPESDGALELSAGTRLLGHTEGLINTAASTLDGSRLATVAVTHRLLTWDTRAAKPTNELEIEWYARLAVSPDERWLAVRDRTRVRVMPFGPVQPDVLQHDSGVQDVRFTADGTSLLTRDSSGSIQLWDTVELERIASLPDEDLSAELHRGLKPTELLDPTGSRVIDLSNGKVRDAGTGALLGKLAGVEARAVAWNPDGSRLASGSGDGTVRIFETEGFETLLKLRGHSGAVLDAAWSADGSLLATASEDGTVRLWNSDRRETRTMNRSRGRELRAAWKEEVRKLLDQLGDALTVAELLRNRTENSPEERRAALRALRDLIGD